MTVEIFENLEGYFVRYEDDKFVGIYTNLELAKRGGPSNVILI